MIVWPVELIGGGKGDVVSGQADVKFLAGLEANLATDGLGDDDLIFGANQNLGLGHM